MLESSQTLRPDDGAPSLRARGEDAASTDASAKAWAAFIHAASEEAFCSAWLALQCALVPKTCVGLLLLRSDGHGPGPAYVPIGVWPDPDRDVTYLASVAEESLTERRPAVSRPAETLRMAPADRIYLAYPLESDGELEGAIVLDMGARPQGELESALRQLLWGTGWLVALLRRRYRTREASLLQRATTALTLVDAAQQHPALDEAAMAVVNELAAAAKADRVSLGVVRNAGLVVRAMSRTAWFDRRSQLVDSIENAMEEAFDQQASVVYPPSTEVRGVVSVAQRDLAAQAGSSFIATVLLKSGGRPVGALTLERTHGAPFDAGTVDVVEAAAELLGPLVESRLDSERWLRGSLIDRPARWWADLVGPRRPTQKLGALLIVLSAVFLAFAQGTFRVTARTFVEGQTQRAAVVPFDGYIAEAFVRAGETVRQGAVLATLDERELTLERTRWEAEAAQGERKYHEALARHDRAAARILSAQREQAGAQLALAEEKLLRARIVAPFDAVVVSGDLSQTLGAPVERGRVLFELAPLDRYRVVLHVDERDIAFVVTGQTGELGLAGLSDSTLPFIVKSVTSVSTAEEGRNFFRVEAQLEDRSEGIRPGMEGVGKVSIGERRLIWIWTRNFVSWLRLSLWSWLP